MALKKSFVPFSVFLILLFGFVSALIFAQTASPSPSSSPQSLAQKFYSEASSSFSEGNLTQAYDDINQAMSLYELFEIPDETILLAREIYFKTLQEMRRTKNFDKFDEVTLNLKLYPGLADNKIIYTMEDIRSYLENKRLADSVELLGEKIASQAEKNTKMIYAILVAIIILFLVIAMIFVTVIFAIRFLAKKTSAQSRQIDSTLRLIAQMQQTNNKLLLGNIIELDEFNGFRLAGSSAWGKNALPKSELSDEERKELKALAINCELLGARIDEITKRKNNSKNVAELVYKLAIQLGLNQNTSMLYFCASFVYDAGFLNLPEELLQKESITEDERKILETHVDKEKFNEAVGFVPEKYSWIFEDAFCFHHENSNGTGYPNNLKGTEIPEVARLIHVAESFNSLSSLRNYKEIQDKESALKELQASSELYDSEILRVLAKII